MNHGTIHGIAPDQFPGGMDRNGMEVMNLLHSSSLTEGTLPRRPAHLPSLMQDKP
jgi:hypothetical protein